MAPLLLALVLVVLLLPACAMSGGATAAPSRLAHDVFFALHDPTPANRAALVDACYRRLRGIPGIVFFAAGARDPELVRDVNDRDFDVALHVYFADRAAHDAYQDHPDHLRFIAENKAGWRQVRVFDSTVPAR